MSKRPSPEASRLDNLPPPKKARYSYDPELMQQRTLPRMSMTTNSDEETVSDPEQQDSVLLKSTTDPIKSNPKIQSDIMVAKSQGDWCPVQWFRNRVYHRDAEDFFNILPYDEANGVAKPLLMFQGGSITLTKNIINTLDTMQKITQFIQTQSCSASNKHNKRKKRFLREQNEIFNTFNIDKLRKDNANYINKIQKDISKHNNINNEYVAYENERKLIWKSSNNNSNCNASTAAPPPPPPEPAQTNNNKLLQTIGNKLNVPLPQHRHSDFVSSSEYDSDEDFTILNDDGNANDFYSSRKRKNKKKKKKKTKRQKLEAEIERERERELALQEKEYDDQGQGGKNPSYSGDTQPQKFWTKFGGYFEPINTSRLADIIPYLQSDIFPRQIPSLPLEKSFVNKSYNFDHDNYNHDMDDDGFDMDVDDAFDMDINDGDDNNELYFAEMPKNYEYFVNKKCYIDEQHNIESDVNGKHLRKDVMYENYPQKSLFGHSFDQRTLSGIIHECDGMYNIEKEADENYWKKIGKNVGKIKNDVAIEMIEPIIKYKKMECESKDSKDRKDGIITFEHALRKEICDNFFGGKSEEIDKIIDMPWHERLDDECSAVIKSLTNNLEATCYAKAPNEIETNVKIAMQIIEMIQDENASNTNNFHSWQDLNAHIHQLQKHYIDTDGAFGIDQNTLAQPQWSQYFKEKQNLPIDEAVQAFLHKNHVRTDV